MVTNTDLTPFIYSIYLKHPCTKCTMASSKYNYNENVIDPLFTDLLYSSKITSKRYKDLKDWTANATSRWSAGSMPGTHSPGGNTILVHDPMKAWFLASHFLLMPHEAICLIPIVFVTALCWLSEGIGFSNLFTEYRHSSPLAMLPIVK